MTGAGHNAVTFAKCAVAIVLCILVAEGFKRVEWALWKGPPQDRVDVVAVWRDLPPFPWRLR